MTAPFAQASRTPRVLVTGGDHVGPLAAVRALRSAGYQPLVSVCTPEAYAAHSHAATGLIFVCDSRSDPAGFVTQLAEAGERLGLDTILAGTEMDLVAIARGRERLGALACGTPAIGAVLEATSKSTVNRLAREVGMKVPETSKVRRGSLTELGEMRMPAVVKPSRSVLAAAGGDASCGAPRLVHDWAQLASVVRSRRGECLLVQQFVGGRLGAVSGVAWRGKVVAAVHQIARRTWPLDIGVSAYAETVAPDLQLHNQVSGLVGLLGWSGIFQAQFMHTPDAAYFIDFNPRIYGSLALAVAAGANLPAIWLELLKGAAPECAGYKTGIRYRREEHDVRAVLHLLYKGHLGAAIGLIPRRHTTHAIAPLTDPYPLLAIFSKVRHRFGASVKRAARVASTSSSSR